MKYLKLYESFGKIDDSVLLKISSEITKQYPNINSGGCGVFARAFHKVTNFPYVLVIDQDLLEQDPPIHMMIELPDGRLYDGGGIRTQKELEVEFDDGETGELMFLPDHTGETADNYYDDLGEGLFMTCHKDDYDDILKIIISII